MNKTQSLWSYGDDCLVGKTEIKLMTLLTIVTRSTEVLGTS